MASSHLYASFNSASDFLEYQLNKDLQKLLAVEEKSASPVFRLSVYPSGELSGAYYLNGGGHRVKPPVNTERVTHALSQSAKSKLRRSIENSEVEMKVFMTLTFAPQMLQPWHFSDDGTVNHDFAKWKFRKFRQALTMVCNRRIKERLKILKERCSDDPDYKEQVASITKEGKYRFVWVAELQEGTGNIHFHLIINQYFPIDYLSKLWGMANNSVDVEWLNDANHTANYLRKYITKSEKTAIKGCRYNICRIMRKDMKPSMVFRENEEAQDLRKLLGKITGTINENGGRVIDSGFGFTVNSPRPARAYIDKKTKRRKFTREVKKGFVDLVVSTFMGVPF